MRLLFLVLFVLVSLIQYPLWLGKGGWFTAWDLQRQVIAQRATNEGLRARNAALQAEVHDLDNGSGAIAERARSELGMMREGEVFVHILPRNTPPPPGGASLAADAVPPPATPPKPTVRPLNTRPARGPTGGSGHSRH